MNGFQSDKSISISGCSDARATIESTAERRKIRASSSSEAELQRRRFLASFLLPSSFLLKPKLDIIAHSTISVT